MIFGMSRLRFFFSYYQNPLEKYVFDCKNHAFSYKNSGVLENTLKSDNEFAFCLLIGQIGSSFLWKEYFVSQLFFLAFKRTLLIVLLQVRRMKVKATMRQISFGQKKLEGKAKSCNMAE